jgi:hypothetical protein
MMPAAVAEYLSQLTLRLETHLERRLAGAWLVGSGALGDFDTRRSDLDVQAVCTTRLARVELGSLAAALSHPALRCPVRGLEFVLYACEDLADPDGPAFQLNLNSGPRMEHHVGYDPDAEPRFWFVLDTAIARERARPLAGLSPSVLLPPPSRPLVLSALRDALAWYRAYDPAEAVLAACRAWAWATRGRWLSKGGAATWAAAQLPDPAAVAKALARRADPGAPGPTPSEVEGLLEPVERLLDARAHAQPSPSREGLSEPEGERGPDSCPRRRAIPSAGGRAESRCAFDADAPHHRPLPRHRCPLLLLCRKAAFSARAHQTVALDEQEVCDGMHRRRRHSPGEGGVSIRDARSAIATRA